MANQTPTINCFAGEPVLLPDGTWGCSDPAAPVLPMSVRRKGRGVLLETPNPTPAPQPTFPTLDIKNCRRHQAPPNYTYVWNGYDCALVSLADAPAYIKRLQAAGIDATGSGTTAGAGSDIGSSVSNAISAHPLLVLAGVAGLIYMFANKGMKPKSREVVSTTRY